MMVSAARRSPAGTADLTGGRGENGGGIISPQIQRRPQMGEAGGLATRGRKEHEKGTEKVPQGRLNTAQTSSRCDAIREKEKIRNTGVKSYITISLTAPFPFTSLLQSFNVNFVHLEHRLHDTLRFFLVVVIEQLA